jgi:transcriptional regulator with XRE-family HTH domain
MISDTDLIATSRSCLTTVHTWRVVKPTPRTVWARVSETLQERRLPTNQRFVAKRLGVSQPAVALWNKTGGYPTMDNAVELAKLLDVNVEWLLTERGPKRPLPQDAPAQELWRIWSHLDDVTKGKLIGIASGSLQRGQDSAA